MVFLLFENLERASFSLLMLSAKQGSHWYHFFNVFGMPRHLSGIEPLTFRIHRALYHWAIIVSCIIYYYYFTKVYKNGIKYAGKYMHSASLEDVFKKIVIWSK